MRGKAIVMLGTDFAAPGGITAVVRAYQAAGMFQRWRVRFIATYRKASTFSKLQTAAWALLQFLSMLVRRDVACVHAHVAARGSFWRKGLFLRIGIATGVRTIFHLHDGSFRPWYESRSAPVRWAVRTLLRSVDRVVVLTSSMQTWVLSIQPRARTVIIGNPVRLAARMAASDRQTVLFLGRLWPEKGIYDLLEAAAIVRGTGQKIELICAGDGDLQAVQHRAGELGLTDCLSLPGWVDGSSKEALMLQAGIFVLPSYFEGLPMGVLEAMAHGIPVVASALEGIADAVGHDAGILVPAGDAKSLAAALAALLADPGRRARMGEAGRLRVAREFETEKVLFRVDALYEDLGLKPATPQV